MEFPNYVKDIYLFWRGKKKHQNHIYLRTPHQKVLTRKRREFQRLLRKETGNRTAAFTLSNLIELMTQQCFDEEPEIERHIVREVVFLKEIENE